MVSMFKALFASLWARNTTESIPTGDGDPPYISCPPWALSNPTIRLHEMNHTTRLYGYPAKVPGPIRDIGFETPGPPFLYLRGDIPAYVDYIMGDNWREDLTSMPTEEGLVVLRPGVNEDSPTNDDEEQHSLRMLRCRAIVAYSLTEIALIDTGYYIEEERALERPVFGWPREGGVWVLPAPKYYASFEEQLAHYVSNSEDLEDDRFYTAMGDLRHAEDMDAICNILKEAGARFYADLNECPDVKKFNLG